MGSLRRHPVVSVIVGVLLLVVGVIVVTGIAVWRAAHTDDASQVERVDAIVVLGAAQYDGEPSPVFAGRLDHAQLLYEQDRADTVLVIGGGAPGDSTTEAEAGGDYLIDAGLPDASVLAVGEGSTTFESLRSTARAMREAGLDSAFLVSDPWHNLRIRRMASDLGIEAYASATWQSAATSERTRVPGYLRETFAYLYYRLFGR
ncbi:MAG: YdcF family protein [Actinomycetota bacterium]